MVTDREQDDDARLSTDDGIRPHFGTRIGTEPGQSGGADISGAPGGGTGWGSLPHGMGTHDDSPGLAGVEAAGAEEEDNGAGKPRMGSDHGEAADSGVNTAPVGT
jgi:hypothetical protein